MSAAGATGPAPTAGSVTAPVTTLLADQQQSATNMEIQESHRQTERRAARLGVPVKKINGAAPVSSYQFLGETIDTGIPAAATAKRTQAESIKHEAPGKE